LHIFVNSSRYILGILTYHYNIYDNKVLEELDEK